MMAAQYLHLEASDLDAQADTDASQFAHEREVASRLEVGELITEICQEVAGDSGDSSLFYLVDGLCQAVPWDWDRPQIAHHVMEDLGKYVARRACMVVERALTHALQGED
jgi:hypothetical protein